MGEVVVPHLTIASSRFFSSRVRFYPLSLNFKADFDALLLLKILWLAMAR